MKKSKLTVILALITAVSLAGCGEKEEEVEVNERPRERTEVAEATPTSEPEPTIEVEPPLDGPGSEMPYDLSYEEVYAPVLDEISGALADGYDYDRDYKYVPSGLIELIMYEDKDRLPGMIGYRYDDISGDGIPELLIGRNELPDTDAPAEVATVYGCYTCRDDEPVVIFEGMTRSTFRWSGNGVFNYFGSGGAMFSLFGTCHLDKDGTQVWDDFYFSDEKEDGTLGFYHNTSGVCDAALSEELNISDVEFWNLLSDQNYESLDWTYFDSYTAGTVSGSGSVVSVEWADGVVDESTDYIAYDPDYTDQYTTHVLISTNKPVKNFRIVELTIDYMGDDGYIEFIKEEKFRLDELTPDKPLCAGINFPGDSPHNGYIYTDDNGEDRFFIIDVSGMDGSLMNYEYE
ncbi:MAG: hypothetical protein K5686_03825 [Lachnospiraceae bacterium]|nr:hypothetical protein [Lachnospiraceae bacterium]